MEETRNFLTGLRLPPGDRHDLPSSPKRFPDGAHYRIEIPSCEGPEALRAVAEEADRYGVTIHRISQGSGIMLLTDREIVDMARLGRERGMEVSLFVGPRAAWDTGATAVSPAGRVVAPRIRGADQLVFAMEDVRHGCDLGIRSVLVADEGLLWVLGEMKRAGTLPADLVLKVSVMMGSANPASIAIMERLGAGTYNIPTDLSLAQIAAIRQAVDVPLDIYVEAPDDLGGFVRHYEIPELIRVAAPVYIKFGLKNAPGIYPSGTHLEATAVALVRERVRRARLGVDMIRRYAPTLAASSAGAAGLGIPAIPAGIPR
ncbi:MAG TPA: U32 family peptidase [bacterium]|nr:U32 family peptidase [bacterium]